LDIWPYLLWKDGYLDKTYKQLKQQQTTSVKGMVNIAGIC